MDLDSLLLLPSDVNDFHAFGCIDKILYLGETNKVFLFISLSLLLPCPSNPGKEDDGFHNLPSAIIRRKPSSGNICYKCKIQTIRHGTHFRGHLILFLLF